MEIIELNNSNTGMVVATHERQPKANLSRMAAFTAVTKDVNYMLNESEYAQVFHKYYNRPYGLTMLLYAIMKKDVRSVEVLLKHGASANECGYYQEERYYYTPSTAIGFAALYGNKELVSLLIQYGANLHSIDGPLLFYPAQTDNSEIIIALLEAGVDINEKMNNETALYLAATGSPKALQTLIDCGADIYASERSPLLAAVSSNSIECVKILWPHSSKVEERDEYGNTVLHYAGNLEIIDFLISEGADPNSTNLNGFSPLHNWINNGIYLSSIEIDSWCLNQAKILLENGANPNLKDNEGKTALQIASQIKDPQSREKVEQLLKSYGAK
ncbi:MAG TPA: ankyrin repeat domain-containing protein [Chlamydiales bacterium]|nr:ankyrin repeat domain-containing protein [Chlamydiales bacterium]